MLYDNYENRIKKIARIKATIHRFRYLIIAGITLVVALTVSLVSTKGIVKIDKGLETTYVYGEEYEVSASGFMSDISYEYSIKDSDIWSEEKPKNVGEYVMRAKSHNSFGSYYSKQQQFSIVKKPIVISAKENKIVYGKEFSFNYDTALAFSDHFDLSKLEYKIEDKELDTWKVNPIISSISVLDEFGDDVTFNYEFTAEVKSISITQTSLSIETPSHDLIYDGTKHSDDTYIIKSGKLVKGDILSFKQKEAFASAGSYSPEFNIKITDSDGLDMTRHYNIHLQKGNVNIAKRPLTLYSDSYEYTYDGEAKEITNSDCHINEEVGALCDGHTISYDIQTNGCLYAGSYENTFEATIYDRENNDVTANYEINYEYGQTNILKRPISIKTASNEFLYDGLEHSDDTFTITSGSLVYKDSIVLSDASEFIAAGNYSNERELKIIDKDSEIDCTSSYDIDLTFGEIKVAQRKIDIAIEPVDIVYDGLPHKNTYLVSGEVADGQTLEVSNDFEVTDVGEYDNNDFAVDIVDINENSVIDNYLIDVTGREKSIVISKRKLSIEIINHTKLYDGVNFGISSFKDEDVYNITEGTLADNEELVFSYDNDPIDAGTYSSLFTFKVIRNNDEKSDVTANYELSITDNTYQINKRSLMITTSDIYKVYDGSNDLRIVTPYEIISESCDGLLPGHTLCDIVTYCDEIYAGSYDQSIDQSYLKIIDAQGNDVTKNYEFSFVNLGKLNILPRDVYLYVDGGSKVYDGKPLSVNTCSCENIVEGDRVVISDLPSVTHVREGWVYNAPSTIQFYNSSGVDISSSYNVVATFADYIYITQRDIKIESESYEKVFDNAAINEGKASIIEGSMVEGESIVFSDFSSIDALHVSDSGENTYNYSFVNADLLDYCVTCCYGTIDITPYQVDIGFVSTEVIYDGQEHMVTLYEALITSEGENIYLDGCEMLEGFTIEEGSASVTGKEPGSYYNMAFSLMYHGSSYAWIDDFSFTEVNCPLTITPITIVVSSLGGSKEYDGEPFPNECWISFGSLLDGHTISYGPVTPLISVCENEPNPIGEVTITDADGSIVTNYYIIFYNYGGVTIYE